MDPRHIFSSDCFEDVIQRMKVEMRRNVHIMLSFLQRQEWPPKKFKLKG